MTLRFAVDTAGERLNAFHKIDTLITTLDRFRDGRAAEADLRADRQAKLDGRA